MKLVKKKNLLKYTTSSAVRYRYKNNKTFILKGKIEDEPSIYNYGNMKYLDRVIKETFRLYPPVPYLSRQLDEYYTRNNGNLLL